MHKEKGEKSAPSEVDFPAGNWAIFIRDESVYIGHLNLIQISKAPVLYVGAMQFDNNPEFGNVTNLAFSVEITGFHPEDGKIDFQILGAANLYNPNTGVEYQFVFEGRYEEGKLYGTAKVPKNFGKVWGLPGEDGDNVIWRSVGPMDQPRILSR
jgi:hypothetical protein